MSDESTSTCSYLNCERPDEGKLRWTDDGEVYVYCGRHLRDARNQFADTTELVEDE